MLPFATALLGGRGKTKKVVYLRAGTTSWTVPAGVTKLDKVECLGAGGNGGGSGGTGGAYARTANIVVTPGAVLTVSVSDPNGSDYYTHLDYPVGSSMSSVSAQGGPNGGYASNSQGDVTYSGGRGAYGSSYNGYAGGGAGGAAGPSGSGGDGTAASGSYGGAGGNANGTVGASGGTAGGYGAGGAGSNNNEFGNGYGCGSGGGGGGVDGGVGHMGGASGGYGGGGGGGYHRTGSEYDPDTGETYPVYSQYSSPGGPGLIVITYVGY